MSISLSLLVLRARNVELTRDFYEALGLQFQLEQHGSGPSHYASQMGDLVLEIYPLLPDQTEVNDSVMLGFQVESLDLIPGISGDKDRIKTTPDGERFCMVQDPDGHKVRLTEIS